MSDPKHLRIVKLEAANVKRLVAVEIAPDGNLIVIGGKNGAGKSSVLDSIAYALGGRDLLCERPLRDGADRGHVEVDLGDLVVRRTFTPSGGGTLTVSNKEGAVYKSPQAMLDKLVGRLSFDPLDFARMEPRRQLDTLRALVGLDFSEIDAKRKALYDTRTAVNAGVRSCEARLATMPEHPDAPAEEVSAAALFERLEAAQATQRDAEAAEERFDDLGRDLAATELRISEIDAEIKRLQGERATHEADAETIRSGLVEARESARQALDAVIDPTPIREQIESADATNAKVRVNRERAAQAAELDSAKAESARLTAEIEALDAEKAATLAATKFPVDGLSFDESGVLLAGVPFSQGSSAEQLRASVAMGLAMNPRLRVLLIRDGSLLDEDSLALVASMAQEADAQVWMERVSEGDECSVVIEDGAVRAAEAEAAA